MRGTLFDGTAAELSDESKGRPFDCVIVGAGSAGLTVARTLAEGGKRVALIEGGPAPFLTNIRNTELRFAAELTRNIREQVTYSPMLPNGEPFGRNFGCLGGRGLFWDGASPRFRDHDFEGWPFNASDIAGEFEWAETEFRVTRSLGESALAERLIASLQRAGLAAQSGPIAVDLSALGPTGRLSAGIASGLTLLFRGAGDAVADGRIRIAVNTLAEQLVLSGNQVTGVVASTRGSQRHEIRARSVALAGGGVESVRLASMSDVPDHSGRLGRGIQDHIFYRCYFEGTDLYAGFDVPQSAVVYVPSASQTSEQWEIHAPGRRLFSLDDEHGWNPAPGPAYQVMMRAFMATDKQNTNRVEAKPGPLGSATVHFEYSAADRQRREHLKVRAREIGEALGLSLVEGRLLGPGGSYHEAGGLDMGTDSRGSVTDSEGRFHLVPNLLSVDAASFPRIGATNPHLTIVAVARRKAKALAAQL